MASELTPVPDDLDFGVTVRGLVVSQQVFGRYTLRHVLGRGGMGVVWLAHDERLERDVALKFLPDAVNFDAGALDDLKRETRRCLDLTHPNIIRIYDFVKDQQAAAISMEYIDGKTLATLRIDKENRVFEAGDLNDWMTQACQALFYAHEEVKVVHRDLKPANLMLTSRGQLKIADFGIARSVSDSMTQVTMRRATSGTLVYMSPQQMNGDVARVTDDIYALGATIYEFLTSKPPFYSGDIPFQVRQSIPRKMAERREELGISGSEIPKEWEDTVAACLEKSPGQRPKDMLEVAERLGLSVGTRPTRSSNDTATKTTVTKEQKVAAPPPKLPKPPRKPFPTKFLAQIAGGIVGIILLSWALWAFVLWPFIATPGDLFVDSDPLGATVHISGQTDRITPAEFKPLRIGRYHVTVSETGFDPDEESVTITEGAVLHLGPLHLKRTFGKLNLASEPSHARYSLAGMESAADTNREGATPDFLTNLPAGKYQLTLSEAGLAPYTETIEVPAHDTLAENIDLIRLGLTVDASPDPTKVFLGQMDASQLDAKGKSELIDLRKKAFTSYLSYGMTVSAADELEKLKALGQDASTNEKELVAKRASIEKQYAGQIGELLDEKKFATAQLQLQGLNGVLEKDSVDRLNTQFQPRLTQYQQQVDAAIKMSQSGPPAAGYEQLKAFATQYPNDVTLQLALGKLETEMPPDHDKLVAQIKAFRQFAAQNKEAALDPDFQAMQDKFSNELRQLDILANALADAKNGPTNVRSRIASLEQKKATAENRRVGAANVDALANTANFFGRVVTGHSVVGSGATFDTEQEKQQEIDRIQSQIDAAQQSLTQPQGSVDEAQRRYDDFVAHVPW
jgi:serine/threonine protein kinase